MDIRLGSVQPDSTRYSDVKRAKKVKTKSRQPAVR
jgi:hypothetical protein